MQIDALAKAKNPPVFGSHLVDKPAEKTIAYNIFNPKASDKVSGFRPQKLIA